MKEITPQLTDKLKDHFGNSVGKKDAFPVETYDELVRIVAELSYLNRDNLLFFRGQTEDYRNKAGATTLYPALYRKNIVSRAQLQQDFSALREIAAVLSEMARPLDRRAADEIRRRQYIQWSIVQHYQVHETPLLDLSQSLRVACSFAQLEPGPERVYVYAIGLPYMPNGISINSEQEIVNVRLLSVCPPLALRPYFQEGFLAGTTDITDNYDDKNELDFNRRLVAKFSIPNGPSFWRGNLDRIPRGLLFLDEENDRMHSICSFLRDAVLRAKGMLVDAAGDSAELEDAARRLRSAIRAP